MRKRGKGSFNLPLDRFETQETMKWMILNDPVWKTEHCKPG